MRRRSGSVAAPASAATSMPAEKTLPAPRTTTTRTFGSSAAVRNAVPVASTSSPLNALRLSGRWRTTWRTGPRSSVIPRSDTAAQAIWWGPMDLAGVRELLRPPPHRGPLIAAGAVALGVGIALEEIRVADKLRTCGHMVILLLAGALIYWLGVQAPNEEGQPPAYQSVLLVTGLLLLFAGLLTLSDVLGAGFDGFPAGAIVWASLLSVALSLWPALERNSAICLLLAATFGAFVLLAGWRFVFGEVGLTPYRWLLLVVACGCVLVSLVLREPAPRHAQQLVNAAGLAIAAIGVLSVA